MNRSQEAVLKLLAETPKPEVIHARTLRSLVEANGMGNTLGPRIVTFEKLALEAANKKNEAIEAGKQASEAWGRVRDWATSGGGDLVDQSEEKLGATKGTGDTEGDVLGAFLKEVCPRAVEFFCDTEEEAIDGYLGECQVVSNNGEVCTLSVLMEAVLLLMKYDKMGELMAREYSAAVVDAMLASCRNVATGKVNERALAEVSRKFGDPGMVPRMVLKQVAPTVLDLLDGKILPADATEDELEMACDVWVFWDGKITDPARGSAIQVELERGRAEQRRGEEEKLAKGRKKGKKVVVAPADKNSPTTIAAEPLEVVTEKKGLERAMDQGRMAFREGKPRAANPYEKDSYREVWNIGWRDGFVQASNGKTVKPGQWDVEPWKSEAHAMGARAAEKGESAKGNPFGERLALQLAWDNGYGEVEESRGGKGQENQAKQSKEIKEDEADGNTQ